ADRAALEATITRYPTPYPPARANGVESVSSLAPARPAQTLPVRKFLGASPKEQVPFSHPTNLPYEPTHLIGRKREIDQIVGLLQDPQVRMVTLTGPGGTG